MNPVYLVFDLDDTLYLERDFVRSGYRAAAAWALREHGLGGLEDACLALFEAGRRRRVFDEALQLLGRTADPDLVQDLVAAYRGHAPEIALAPDALRYLARTQRRDRPLALITDGPAATQQGKVRALGLERWMGLVLCTGVWGAEFSKPHPRAFETVEAEAARLGLSCVYVADNPLKDFLTPRARGWLTVQIERPERVHRVLPPDDLHAPHARIDTLRDLETVIAETASGSALLRTAWPAATPAGEDPEQA